MQALNQAANAISNWVSERNIFSFPHIFLERRHYFLHLPGRFLKRLFSQKSNPHIPQTSKEKKVTDPRTIKLWENQDYPLWELKTIAKEGSIQGYKITTFRPINKIDEQSKRIGGHHEIFSAHKYITLPIKKEEKDPPPEPWHPDRATDSRMRVSRL